MRCGCWRGLVTMSSVEPPKLCEATQKLTSESAAPPVGLMNSRPSHSVPSTRQMRSSSSCRTHASLHALHTAAAAPSCSPSLAGAPPLFQRTQMLSSLGSRSGDSSTWSTAHVGSGFAVHSMRFASAMAALLSPQPMAATRSSSA